MRDTYFTHYILTFKCFYEERRYVPHISEIACIPFDHDLVFNIPNCIAKIFMYQVYTLNIW